MTRPFSDLSESGLLWLINRVVFHPRGYALTLHSDKGVVSGWTLDGDGSAPWAFDEATDDEKFLAAQLTIQQAYLDNTCPLRETEKNGATT